jgi:hypothetical protein
MAGHSADMPPPDRPDDPFDDEAEIDLREDFPTLDAVRRFARVAREIPWFTRVGERLSRQDRLVAEAYLEALGFPDAGVAEVEDWWEAAVAATNLDVDTPAFEVEEQQRVALTAEALELLDEELLTFALTHVAGEIAEIVETAAADAALRAGYDDDETIRAAAGAAIQAAHQAALVLAAGVEDETAAAHKIRLFESGRWPLGLIGSTLHIF